MGTMVAVCCCVSQLAAASPGQGPAAAGRPGSSGAGGLIATTYPVDGSAMGVALNSIGAQSTAGTREAAVRLSCAAALGDSRLPVQA